MFSFFKKKPKVDFVAEFERLVYDLNLIVDRQQAEIQTLKQDFEILQKQIFKKTYNDRRKIIKTVNKLLKEYADKTNKNRGAKAIQKQRQKTQQKTN